jgi:hypothetical protein
VQSTSGELGTCSASHNSPVEKDPLVRPFSLGSTLEPGLKGFHRRGH